MPAFPPTTPHRPRLALGLCLLPLFALACAGCGASTSLAASGRQALLADVNAAQAGLGRHDVAAVRDAVRRFEGEVGHLRAGGELTPARAAELTTQAQAILTEAGSLSGGVVSATARRSTTTTATETVSTAATATSAGPAPPAHPAHGPGQGPGGAGPPGQAKHGAGPPGHNQGDGNQGQGSDNQSQNDN